MLDLSGHFSGKRHKSTVDGVERARVNSVLLTAMGVSQSHVEFLSRARDLVEGTGGIGSFFLVSMAWGYGKFRCETRRTS